MLTTPSTKNAAKASAKSGGAADILARGRECAGQQAPACRLNVRPILITAGASLNGWRAAARCRLALIAASSVIRTRTHQRRMQLAHLHNWNETMCINELPQGAMARDASSSSSARLAAGQAWGQSFHPAESAGGWTCRGARLGHDLVAACTGIRMGG